MEVFYVKPRLGEFEASKRIERSLKGFFGRKGEFIGGRLIYYPFYEVEADVRVGEVKLGRLRYRYVRKTVSVDAVKGYLCNHALQPVPIARVVGMSRLEVAMAREMLEHGKGVKTEEVATHLGVAVQEAEKVLKSLEERGILRFSRGKWTVADDAWTMLTLIPDELISPSQVKGLELVKGDPPSPKVEPKVKPEEAAKAVEDVLYGKVRSLRLTYCPFYIGKVKRKDGTTETIAVEPVKGETVNREAVKKLLENL